MPTISTFRGIVVRMFYGDHEPVHFHAEHEGRRGKLDLAGRLIVGDIRSSSALRSIRAWALLHERELKENRRRSRLGEPLERIEPLL